MLVQLSLQIAPAEAPAEAPAYDSCCTPRERTE